MELRQLNAFVHVAELGSFTRAASALGVAQPALSRQVRALEVELRQALFERNGRGVTLTPAGHQLLAHGRGILQQVARARQELENQRGDVSGWLSIGLPPSLSRLLTADLVGHFRERFPRATLSVVEGLSTYTLEWLQQGRIDCALIYNATPGPAVRLEHVVDEPLFLMSRPLEKAGDVSLLAPPVTLAALSRLLLVIPSRPHALRMRVETALAEIGRRPQVAMEIESVLVILDLVERHALHAVLGRQSLLSSGHEGRVLARPIMLAAGQQLSAGLFLATSSQRPGGPLLDQASALLAELLRLRMSGL